MDASESRYKGEIRSVNVIPWMFRHSGNVITRYQVGSDGKTAWGSDKGRKFKRDVAEFGECVWYLKLGSNGKGLDRRWGSGVFLGVRGRRKVEQRRD